MMLSGKENYMEWLTNIEHNIIFNDLWDGIFDGDTSCTKSIEAKDLEVMMNNDYIAYAFIILLVSEEVSHHIMSIKNCWSYLK